MKTIPQKVVTQEIMRTSLAEPSSGEALVQPPVRKTDGWKHQLAAYHFVMHLWGLEDAEDNQEV